MLTLVCFKDSKMVNYRSKAVQPPVMLMSLDQRHVLLFLLSSSHIKVVSEIRALKTHFCSSLYKS